MEDAKKRLQILLGDTLQVLEHMIVVDSEYNEMLRYIKDGLNEHKRKTAEISLEELMNEANTIIKKLNDINSKVQKLESNLLEDYKKTTDNDIEGYEDLSIDEQRKQTETYHDKIDYLSAVKVKENINEIIEILVKLKS